MRRRVIYITVFILIFTLLLPGCSKPSLALYAPDITIGVGDVFYELEGVSALDSVQGDITDQVQVVKSNVNTLKPGTYRTTYQVTNDRGQTATATRKVTVKHRGFPPLITGIYIILLTTALVLGLVLSFCGRRRRR
ncbi:MAG: immunoglobulin-like domain-containing protein [Christensenellales bacterium]|jgi:major membrane immunogen (membrane-anchored lipoprotein)